MMNNLTRADDENITKILEENKLSRFQTTSKVGMYIDLKDASKVELLKVMNALQDKGYILIKTPEKNVFKIMRFSRKSRDFSHGMDRPYQA